MNNKTINLHIDKIVLDGVGQLNRGQLNLAIEKELHRLISTQGLHRSFNQSGSINQIAAKPIVLPGQIREKSLGNKIANSVYRCMKR